MSLASREFWTVAHGMVLGAVLLLAFAGGFAGLWSLRPGLLTPAGVAERVRRMAWGFWTVAVLAWITCITGTYIVYPWYRAPIPDSPRSLLLADASRAAWHTFGMEWKEHAGWAVPILATAVAVIVTVYRGRLADLPEVRRFVLFLFVMTFIAATVAGLFGAFLNKIAPIV